MILNKIIIGNAYDVLKDLETQSIDCVITSPPYWRKRNYKVKGQIGLEKDVEEYIIKLNHVFTEVYRVLKPSGTCWLNLGYKYINKRLYMLPEMLTMKMIANKWILRNQIIWHKPNAIPEAVRDRFTLDYEKIIFFVKNKKYYFQQQFEPYNKPLNRWGGNKLSARNESSWDKETKQNLYRDRLMRPNPRGRNMRSVWSINTSSSGIPHFATFPLEIPLRCIRAGCPEGGIVLDPFMGSGTTALAALRTNRKFIGIDINEEYVQIANKRIEKERKRVKNLLF